MPATNIIVKHRSAFEALTSGKYDNFALFCCRCNDQPAAAIVAITAHQLDGKHGEAEFHVKPLLISVTPEVKLTDHDGCEA